MYIFGILMSYGSGGACLRRGENFYQVGRGYKTQEREILKVNPETSTHGYDSFICDHDFSR